MAIKKIIEEIEIGALFDKLNLKDVGEYKSPTTLKVLTPDGFKKVEGLKKTELNPEWEIETKNGIKTCFTDFHKIEVLENEDLLDFNRKWKFVKNLKTGDKINTCNGLDEIKKVIFNKNYSNMYDLQVSENRCFYTDGIVSHNSIFLMLFAINAYLQGKKVLFISLEMSDEKAAARGLTNIFNISKKEIINNPESVKEKMKNFDANGGSLVIKEYLANTASSNDFEAYLKDLKTYRNWEPDIIFVDYLLIMSTNDKTLPRSDTYMYHKTTSLELRNIAKKHHVPVVTAAQLNRSAQQDNGKGGTKASVTSFALSESRAILDNADFLFTIVQTERDKKENIITLYSDKARDEMNGQRVKFYMDYEHMKAREV